MSVVYRKQNPVKAGYLIIIAFNGRSLMYSLGITDLRKLLGASEA